ncbi:phenylacetic acid degradation operon negative regulatory protein PaaX [Orrella sp. JC864]|uniref:phenylacetic acid degradation operon negative regulatory protein PaaX n=1 Tax=Orrella sp. JC864 TaxID=3120298 RepID=UPI0012BC7D4A
MNAPIEDFLQRQLAEQAPRAKSLCVTLLGDALAPHGGAIWLGDLIELTSPLGVNERLLRTSVFRLVSQGWLQSERIGRRSLYTLSPQGLRLTAHASARIYIGPPSDWNGEWTLVILPRTGNGQLAERAELRRELVWEGFGVVAPGVFAHPQADAGTAHEILEKLEIPGRALVLRGHELPGAGGLPLSSLVQLCWNLDELAAQYRDFSARYAALQALLARQAPSPAQAFTLRTLLIHGWRRIVLNDPQLPAPLLPPDWPGLAARRLCGALYWQLFAASETHLQAIASRDNAAYTPLAPGALSRFEGAPAEAAALAAQQA